MAPFPDATLDYEQPSAHDEHDQHHDADDGRHGRQRFGLHLRFDLRGVASRFGGGGAAVHQPADWATSVPFSLDGGAG